MGEWDHSWIQAELIGFFRGLRERLRCYAVPEQRVQVKPTRFRIPDVMVSIGKPGEQIITQPPFLVVEVLSPEDRASNVQEKITDYLDFGVPYVWVVDPRTRRAYVHTAGGALEAKDGVLRTAGPELSVPLAEIFQALDE